MIFVLAMFTALPACGAEWRIGKKENQPGLLSEEYIYEEAPFPSCHASTIEQARDGHLVAAWFGGKHEKHPSVGIWVSRKIEGKWTPPVEVANGVQKDGKRHPCWNPVLFQPKDSDLMLLFKVGPSPSTWWGEMMTSSDGGKTWKGRKRLPNNGAGPVKNKPIQMPDGTILCPSSSEHDGWRIHIEKTKDGGKTWTTTGALNKKSEGGAIQPSILHYPDGRMQMLCRNQDGNGKLWSIWSENNGKSWGKLEALSLPNPNSGTDAVTLKDGRQLLVYNHTVRGGENPRGREMLNVAVSRNGIDWYAGLVLESQKGEYSYPAVIQTDDGLVHITYTFRRKKVRHVVVDPKKLVLKKIEDGKWPTE